jgi:hypothetical protein
LISNERLRGGRDVKRLTATHFRAELAHRSSV